MFYSLLDRRYIDIVKIYWERILRDNFSTGVKSRSSKRVLD